jgi:hypothetical protein
MSAASTDARFQRPCTHFAPHTPQSLTPLRRTTGRNTPFRAYAHWRRLETTGRPPLRTKFKLLCLGSPSIRTTVLDARYARLSTHLRSIRRSLDVPAPSGDHPSGPIARRPPWAFVHFGGAWVQKPLRRANACRPLCYRHWHLTILLAAPPTCGRFAPFMIGRNRTLRARAVLTF